MFEVAVYFTNGTVFIFFTKEPASETDNFLNYVGSDGKLHAINKDHVLRFQVTKVSGGA